MANYSALLLYFIRWPVGLVHQLATLGVHRYGHYLTKFKRRRRIHVNLSSFKTLERLIDWCTDPLT